jgi:hypothetical protein
VHRAGKLTVGARARFRTIRHRAGTLDVSAILTTAIWVGKPKIVVNVAAGGAARLCPARAEWTIWLLRRGNMGRPRRRLFSALGIGRYREHSHDDWKSEP